MDVEWMQPSARKPSIPHTAVTGSTRSDVGAPSRNIVVERAKGVLMGRYLITESEAHALLRKHARNANLRLLDVALAVLESHGLLGEGRS